VKLDQIDWKQNNMKEKYGIDVCRKSIENEKNIA